MSLHTHQIDYLDAWNAYLHHRDTARLDAATGRAFWEQHAADYDRSTGARGSYTQTLNALLDLVRPHDMVLDVGAGTGRFALPLAQVVRCVTALDHAPAMLNVLRAKMQADGIQNVTEVEAEWESAEVGPHDVVLAAWSLYRHVDLAGALYRLAAATRRTLVIVAADDFSPPHRQFVNEIWGCDGEPDVPACLLIHGALWQLGIRADLRVVYETRRYPGESLLTLATQLAPADASERDLDRLTHALASWAKPMQDEWEYSFQFPVSLIVWQRLN